MHIIQPRSRNDVINLTNNEVIVVLPDGTHIAFPPSYDVALIDGVQLPLGGCWDKVPLHSFTYSRSLVLHSVISQETKPFPPENSRTLYIVNELIFYAFPEREDLVTTYRGRFFEEGVIHCDGFGFICAKVKDEN